MHPPISLIEDGINTYVVESVIGALVTLAIVTLAMRLFRVHTVHQRIRYQALVVALPLVAAPLFYAAVPDRRALPVLPLDTLLDPDHLWDVIGPSHVWVERFIVAASLGIGVTLAWRVARDLRARGGLSPFRRLGLLEYDAQLSRRAAVLCGHAGACAPVYVLETTKPAAFCAGLRKCTLVVSRGLVDELDAAALDDVLRHELAHCRRRDTRWGALVAAIGQFAVFNPVVVIACRRILELQEQACDDEAVEQSGDALSYARTLLRVSRLGVAYAAAGSRPFLGPGNGLAPRVERLLEPGSSIRPHPLRDTAAWGATATTALAALFFVC